MFVCKIMADLLEALHTKLAVVNECIVKLEKEIDFENRCIYVAKKLLGESTLLHVLAIERVRPKQISPPTLGHGADLIESACILTQFRIQTAIDTRTLLELKLSDTQSRRQLLEQKVDQA
jgi:hypothetical protein